VSKRPAKPTGTIADLKPDPQNPRAHNPRNIGMIVDALHEVGAARSVVIDENDVVLAGNGTIEAAAEAGITKLQVVESDGNTIIAVRRRGLTPEAKRRLSLFDNRTAELADWDADVLKTLEADGALDGLFTGDELKGITTDDPDDVEPITIDRPADVVWVLLAIPIEDWPQHQDAIESLQVAAKFCTQVLRPKDDKAPAGGQKD
jgi:ParB-like chromosome segregation protein Spo0J